jgi:hypothetical protein
MYAIIIPERVNPNKAKRVFLIYVKLESIKLDGVLLLNPVNILATNNIDQIIEITNNNTIIMIDDLVFLKKPPGYVAITVVIITRNKIKPIPPYLENDETFPKAFVTLLFELLNIS